MIKQWAWFLLLLLVAGVEGHFLPFTRPDFLADNFGLSTRDAVINGEVNPGGVQNAWARFLATHNLSHDGVNIPVEWAKLSAQRAVKFLAAIILDLLIALILVWIF